MAGWIKDQVGGFASGVVSGFTDALGISSPSKVMMEIGGYMGEGLHLGMLGSFPTDVSPYLPDLSHGAIGSAVKGKQLAMAGAPGSQQGQSVTNHITVNVTTSADPNEIANAIAWKMKR
jgi:hypothetical protein